MEETRNNDFLGKEKIGKLLRMFSIPCVLSLVIQALYNLVDQIFIGHHPDLGATGNAATGIVYPITVVALAIGLWLGDGVGACMSINQGKKDTKRSAKTIGTALTIGTIISLILTLICLLLKDQILIAIGAKGDILASASNYSNFIIGGFFFFILSCVINPIVRSDGSPKFAMIAMTSGAIINIILDPILLYATNMGMQGAALATFIGQVATFSLNMFYLLRAKTFKLSFSDLKPNFGDLAMVLKFGISSFLTQISIVIISIVTNILLAQYSVSSGYDISITQGVITLAFKVFGIIISIVVGIAAGGQPILGYNYGAKNYDRVKQTFKLITLCTFIVGVISTILFECCPEIFLVIFGDGGKGVDPEVYKNFTILTFRIYLGFILFTCLSKSSAIFFQAIGKSAFAGITSLTRDLIVLVPVSIIMMVNGGVSAFLWSAPIADCAGFILSVSLVQYVYRKVLAKPQEELEVTDAKILPSTKGFIITIARQHGSGGHQIGVKLAEKLHVPFYDKEITSLVAKNANLDPDFIESIEENAASYQSLIVTLDPTEAAIKAQAEILNKIAEQGSAVIVGRCADYILKEHKPVRIFIYANEDYRINRIVTFYHDSEEEAKKYATKSDKQRSAYYQMITNQKWGESSNYDLCIDGSIGIDKAVETIEQYLNTLKK